MTRHESKVELAPAEDDEVLRAAVSVSRYALRTAARSSMLVACFRWTGDFGLKQVCTLEISQVSLEGLAG